MEADINTEDEQHRKDLEKYEEDVKEYNKKLDDYYDKYKAETEKRQISSSENFDKSVLTYASWALGISIAFLKDFVPIDVANFPYLLYLSWYLFFVSIGLTTTSFLISYKGLEVSLEYAYKYYKEKDLDYAEKSNPYTTVVKWFNRVSGFSFVLGMIFTVIFASTNLKKAAMKKKTTRNILQEGLAPTLMTKVMPPSVPLQKGLTPGGMTKVTPPPPPPPSQKPSK